MDNKKLLKDMFTLQDKLNCDTSGDNWRDGVTNKAKIIDWYRCIYMEACESIDSFAWKHWKTIDQEPNWDNLKVELIDIWHFLMSELMVHVTIDEAVDIAYENFTNSIKQDTSIEKMLNTLEDIILFSIKEKRAKNITKDSKLLKAFITACFMMGLDIKALSKLYLGKNALNKFRQDNGYKEGTYIKIWNKQEDNEVMMSIVQDLKELSFDNIYNALESKYQKL